MNNIIWGCIAKVVSRRPIADYLIRRSFRTVYFHLKQRDSDEEYMRRWWLVNPYDYVTRKVKHHWLPFSVRVHHICQPDRDAHLHDHPWDARTIILRGGYRELREDGVYDRCKGDTASINFGEYHQVTGVSDGGVWTLFITWGYKGTWGFKVNGKKVPYREYLNRD